MRITNRLNLPDALIKAIKNDSYNKGECDFSITELLKPARQRALELVHENDIEEDAEGMLYRLYGQIAHGVMERANELDLSEKRFFASFSGKVISGQIDTLSLLDGVLTDYKFTTVYKAKQINPPPPEFVQQLNMQLELLRRNDLDVSELRIVCLARDHRIREFKQNRNAGFNDYPESPITVIPIPMWSREETTKFIEDRITAHLEARANIESSACSNEERYADAPVYAVMPEKGKRAIKLCPNKDLALEVQGLNPGSTIVYRVGSETKKCDDYCSVSQFCSQYKRLKGESDEQ